ncbi:hypothetical protein [Verrucosispora sp. TAA-831]|uniref:hypothetical protein n=1 Tax=Verrucosispora sp. TAA-831 TaxID=3422227 RepID=UPI003D6F5663
MTATAAIKRIRLSAGHYESDRGHVIDRIGREWFITFPGERTPDVSRPTLAEAWAYVQWFHTEQEGA